MNDRPGTIRFTVEERILLHLLDYTTYRLKIEVPPSITQEGISQSIRIHRKHLPRSLKNMQDKDLLHEKTTHVKGKTQRMKTYFLTLNGEAKAHELKDSITHLTICIRDKNGRIQETTIKDIKNLVKGLYSLAEILSCMRSDGIIDITQTAQQPPTQKTLPNSLNIYKKALKQAWKDGKMTRSERDILLNLRSSLNITEKQHVELEEQILETIEQNTSTDALEIYKIALEQALSDKRISRDERAILEKIKKHFNIKDP